MKVECFVSLPILHGHVMRKETLQVSDLFPVNDGLHIMGEDFSLYVSFMERSLKQYFEFPGAVSYFGLRCWEEVHRSKQEFNLRKLLSFCTVDQSPAALVDFSPNLEIVDMGV